MTQNVVSYLNVKETERANREREAHNAAMHAENIRHNAALENISAEQNRIQDAAQRELARHNAIMEQVQSTQAAAATQQAAAALRNALTAQVAQQETQRHNQATEFITREYNLGTLRVGQSQAAAAWRNALTNETALEISRDINRIREMELSETARRNTQTYDLGIRSANLGRDQLALERQRNEWQRTQGWVNTGISGANAIVNGLETVGDFLNDRQRNHINLLGTLLRVAPTLTSY